MEIRSLAIVALCMFTLAGFVSAGAQTPSEYRTLPPLLGAGSTAFHIGIHEGGSMFSETVIDVYGDWVRLECPGCEEEGSQSWLHVPSLHVWRFR